MVGVPNIGNARSFLSICVQDGMIMPKTDAQASVSILYPPVSSFQSLKQKEVGLKKSQLVVSF